MLPIAIRVWREGGLAPRTQPARQEPHTQQLLVEWKGLAGEWRRARDGHDAGVSAVYRMVWRPEQVSVMGGLRHGMEWKQARHS